MLNPNTHNRVVAGSNPAEPTFYCGREVDIKYQHLICQYLFLFFPD